MKSIQVGLSRALSNLYTDPRLSAGCFAADFLQFLLTTALHDKLLEDTTHEQPSTTRETLTAAGLNLIDLHGEEKVQTLITVCDAFKLDASTPEGSQLGSACFYGALGKFLNPMDVFGILPKLFDRLLDSQTSMTVQLAVVKVLPPLVKVQHGLEKEKAKAEAEPIEGSDPEQHPAARFEFPREYVASEERLLDLLEVALNSKDEATRRGAAFGLGASVKGLSIQSLKQNAIMQRIEETVNASKIAASVKQGAIMCLEGLTRALGRLFEPYVISVLPILLKAFADSAPIVRQATHSAAGKIMGSLSAHGVKLVLPSLLAGIDDKQWRTKLACGYGRGAG